MSRAARLRKAIRDRAKRGRQLVALFAKESRAGRWRAVRTEQLERRALRTKKPRDIAKAAQSRRRLEQQREKLARLRKQVRDSRAKLSHWERLYAKLRAQAPLRLRALHVAETLIGVMEHGGNNAGPMVSKIIRENGGSGPEPWCGDFTAYCYRHAGSKTVSRAWAAAWALAGRIIVRSPKPGDVVQYTWQHTGLFVRFVNGNTIETIEGNTGASGAVSDSATGGDGVYRKRRSTSQVMRYVRVTR